jgi:hypothetical protein
MMSAYARRVSRTCTNLGCATSAATVSICCAANDRVGMLAVVARGVEVGAIDRITRNEVRRIEDASKCQTGWQPKSVERAIQ